MFKYFFQTNNFLHSGIKKMHMHHWIFAGLDDEFIIPLKNSWDIHTFSFINHEKHFNCLADSERGPIVRNNHSKKK